MTGVRFLFRVTLRRHDLAAEAWHLKEPQKLPAVLSPEEVKRILAMATSLKARVMLTLSYGCGLRASEVVRLRVCDIDSTQTIIRVVQSKGRTDRHVMIQALLGDQKPETAARYTHAVIAMIAKVESPLEGLDPPRRGRPKRHTEKSPTR